MMNMWMERVKNQIRKILYQFGLFNVVHRIRNKRTLTVFMFHRVLPSETNEYKFSEKEFTFSTDGFSRTLDFIKLHYNVVSNRDVLGHVKDDLPLPDRAALITFDDGWLDTFLHAAPELQKRGLPAVLFLATETLLLDRDRWWQDHLVELLSIPDNWEKIEAKFNIVPFKEKAKRQHLLTAKLANLSPFERHQLLEEFMPDHKMPRQMLKTEHIEQLKSVVSISGHGHTHAPLTYCADKFSDLSDSFAALRSMDLDFWAMSFPHGAYNDSVVEAARAVGFQVLFTSDACISSSKNGIKSSRLIGRIHIPENTWTCQAGQISNSKLATFLFFRRIAQ